MKKLFTSLLLLICLAHSLPAQLLIDWNDEWSYLKGTATTQPDPLWINTGYNASAWTTSAAPFRYGDGTAGTLLSDMAGNYTSLYLRKTFIIEDPLKVDELHISINYDDGFALWINGVLYIQQLTPAELTYNQVATGNHEYGIPEDFVILKENLELLPGENVIALLGYNVDINSSDFYMDLKMEGVTLLPETTRVFASQSSGFFTSPFSTTLNTVSAGDTIKFTLDGSDPRYSTTAITTKSPATVIIDPNSKQGGRGTTGAVVLRASKFKTGFSPSKPSTNTYIFLNQVIAQSHPGGSWPTGSINNQVIDLTMDSRVTTDARYKDWMDDAFVEIPTLSITTDPSHFFDSTTGIYVNARFDGREWERPANVELIYPDGSMGFNIDAGIRIRGGWSRHPEFAKHAFRLYFRTEYGEGKLRYPLYNEKGVNEFDKVDLRTAQNYSWSKGGWEGKYNTFNRDVFSRETHGAMGQPYTRSHYYHLYLNGLYWGIFQTQERAEASFAAEYMGGNKEDYDVIKVEVGENWDVYQIEATDGNTDAWLQVWNMTQQGFTSNANYFSLIGSNAAGQDDPNIPRWVDIDNLIDYMLVIFYGGNFDSPVSKFSNNYNPNNFYCIRNRNTRDGFKFMVHDAEHTLLTDAVSPGIGLQENRVNIGSTGQMNVWSFEKFHPQWLHYRLSQNQEYRIRFADRVYRHFFNEGVLRIDSNQRRFNRTAQMIDMAIIAESARWGDMGVSTPRTKHDDWLPAINQVLQSFMPYRNDIVLTQLLNEGLYSSVKPPVFRNNNNVITRYRLTINESYNVTLENPNSSGIIYYTTDGKDPRAVGGNPSPSAKQTTNLSSVTLLPGQTLKARIRQIPYWSPLHEIVFVDGSLFTNLKVTELMYNPPAQDTIEGKEFEFIELKNTGSAPLKLDGLRFTQGISFTFPTGTVLSPGAYLVIASNTTEFNSFYGREAQFQYTGSFSNAGEKVELRTDKEEIIFSFTYYDSAPWPVEADGGGYSLVSAEVNPTGDPNEPQYWLLSKYQKGSPLAVDEASLSSDVENNDDTQTHPQLLVYPNPAQSNVNINLVLPSAGAINMGIYHPDGRLIMNIYEQQMPAGNHHHQMVLPAGMYLLVMRTADNIITRKVVVQ